MDRGRREAAAARYRPARIRLLVVIEAPAGPGRTFYDPAADPGEELFAHLVRVLFEGEADADKATLLQALKRRGVFVIELDPDGTGERPARELAAWLPLRIEGLAPEHVVLVGAAHRAAAGSLRDARLPLIDPAVPFPEPGREADFARELRAALVRSGLEGLIKPLRPAASRKRSAAAPPPSPRRSR